MMPISPKKKIYIILLVFGLVILFLILLIILPLIYNIQDNSEKLLSAKNNAASFQIQNDEINNFKKVYDEYKPNLTTIDQLFIDPQNPVDFIKFLENIAASSHVTPRTSLSPTSDKNRQNFITFQVTINDANFLDIMHFTEKLEHGPYLVEIESMTTKASDNQLNAKIPSGKVDVTFTIKAFTKL